MSPLDLGLYVNYNAYNSNAYAVDEKQYSSSHREYPSSHHPTISIMEV
jgi:hypothetical protein